LRKLKLDHSAWPPAVRQRIWDQWRGELISRILSDEIHCVGVRLGPVDHEEPELIPKYIFSKADIDWQRSIVRAFKRTYEAVRIVPLEESVSPRQEGLTSSKRIGRPSVTSELNQVVKLLRAEGQLKDVSKKEQINRVRKRARELFSNKFPTPSQPSRNKILQALRAGEKHQSSALCGSKSPKSS